MTNDQFTMTNQIPNSKYSNGMAMICGYDSQTVNEYGLKQMREISLAVSPDDLRGLAQFFVDTAAELEKASSGDWHRHISGALHRRLGCDVVISRETGLRPGGAADLPAAGV